jgi:two-component system LytT family response regulator
MTLNAVIIEDEKQSRIRLRNLIEKHADLITLVGEADSVDNGYRLIENTMPDLVFLDIRLSQQTGFDLLSRLGKVDFEVIFVSGYDQYGITAIKFSALDYLVKPVHERDLTNSIRKALQRHELKRSQTQIANLLSIVQNPARSLHRIALPLMKELRFVNPSEIVRCESANNCTYFHLNSGEKLLISRGMFEYEDALYEYGFIRCHHSHIVNQQYIKSLLRKDYTSELILTTGIKIPVSKHKLANVKATMMK